MLLADTGLSSGHSRKAAPVISKKLKKEEPPPPPDDDRADEADQEGEEGEEEDDREGDEVVVSESEVGDDAGEASSDSDEPVRGDNRIIVPPHQVLPRDQMMMVAEWLGILPAVVEHAGHGSGLL